MQFPFPRLVSKHVPAFIAVMLIWLTLADVFSGTDGFVTTITSQTTTDIVNILTDQSPSTTVLAGPAIGKAAAVIQNSRLTSSRLFPFML